MVDFTFFPHIHMETQANDNCSELPQKARKKHLKPTKTQEFQPCPLLTSHLHRSEEPAISERETA